MTSKKNCPNGDVGVGQGKNVISCCNAGKKTHGEKHWLWAVWIGVSDDSDFDEQEPKVSGFAESKSKARQAAWAALKAYGYRSAYYRGWTHRWLWSLREKDTRPLFSRFNLGTDRWYWVVGNYFEEPIATGRACSPNSAMRDAEMKVGPVRPAGNDMARGHWQKQRAICRSKKQASCSAASSLEFVYKCHQWCSDYDGSYNDSIEKFRIVKRTKARIYVDSNQYRENLEPVGDWRDWVESTFTLNRQEFETMGKATRSSKGWWSRTYYASPEVYFAERRCDSRAECFVILDIEASSTEKQVKSAYRRLAKKTHPDSGGDPEKLKRVRRAYEQAMAIVAPDRVA